MFSERFSKSSVYNSLKLSFILNAANFCLSLANFALRLPPSTRIICEVRFQLILTFGKSNNQAASNNDFFFAAC